MIRLTDEEITNITDNIACSFIGDVANSGLDFDVIVRQAIAKNQLKKVVELIITDSDGFDGYNQSPVIISHKLWQALLEEVK